MQVLKLLKQIQLEERGEVEPPPIALPTAEDFDEDFDEDEDEEDEDDDDEEEDSDEGRAVHFAQHCTALAGHDVLPTCFYIQCMGMLLCYVWPCVLLSALCIPLHRWGGGGLLR